MGAGAKDEAEVGIGVWVRSVRVCVRLNSIVSMRIIRLTQNGRDGRGWRARSATVHSIIYGFITQKYFIHIFAVSYTELSS